MLKIVHGDLFEHAVGACVIAHGCNKLGKMGSGFAVEIRNRFPVNFLEYRQLCLNNRLKLGEWLCVHEDGKAIFNLITQETYGNDPNVVYVDYAAVEKGLRAVEWYGRTYNLPIHFPLIGGGKAHGDKQKLMAIFEEVFAKSKNAVLYLFKTD